MSGQPNGGGGGHFYGFADDPAQDRHIQNMIDHASDFLPLQGISQASSHTLGASDFDGNDGEHFNIYGHLSTSTDELDDFGKKYSACIAMAMILTSEKIVDCLGDRQPLLTARLQRTTHRFHLCPLVIISPLPSSLKFCATQATTSGSMPPAATNNGLRNSSQTLSIWTN